MSTTTPGALPTQLRAITTELGTQFFERREHLEMFVITILAKQHIFLIGPPGTAKSAMIRAICERVLGMKFFDILLDPQLGKEELFGPIDIPLFEKSGKWERNINGTMADAHLVFLDEVGKAGPAVLTQMLTVMNERLYRPNGAWIKTPLLSAFGASNEMLEPSAAAMYDRFLVRMEVNYIQEPANFAALLRSAVVPPNGKRSTPTSVTLEDLRHAIDNDVPAVNLPQGILDTLGKLKIELRTEQVVPSDRRWNQAMRLMQASAYFNGRSVVDDEDLSVLQHVLWDTKEQKDKVQSKVLALGSETARVSIELQKMLDDIDKGLASRKGQSVQTRAAYGGEVQAKLADITSRLSKATETANRQGRSTARLDSVRDHLKSTKVTVLTTCLNLTPDRAAMVAEK